MEDILLNKQVNAYITVNGKQLINQEVLSIIMMMYPGFKLVKSKFEIYPNQSFIYTGDIQYINSVKTRPEPHIIIATTGEYDLNDKHKLVEVIYARKNKKVPQYLDELIDNWDDATFYYNVKLLLVNGVVPEKELNRSELLLNIISNFSRPVDLIKSYFESMDDDYAIKYLESNLISFINKSRNIDEVNTKNKRSFILRQSFHYSYDKNVSKAVYKLLESSIDNLELKNLNFILDLIWEKR